MGSLFTKSQLNQSSNLEQGNKKRKYINNVVIYNKKTYYAYGYTRENKLQLLMVHEQPNAFVKEYEFDLNSPDSLVSCNPDEVVSLEDYRGLKLRFRKGDEIIFNTYIEHMNQNTYEEFKNLYTIR